MTGEKSIVDPCAQECALCRLRILRRQCAIVRMITAVIRVNLTILF